MMHGTIFIIFLFQGKLLIFSSIQLHSLERTRSDASTYIFTPHVISDRFRKMMRSPNPGEPIMGNSVGVPDLTLTRSLLP